MSEQELWRRWRLILGDQSLEEGSKGGGKQLSANDRQIDQSLEALYDAERKGSLSDAAPDIARWLGDIRTYFPESVVQLMQQDALERLDLRRMLLEPELLRSMVVDVALVGQLIALNRVMPQKTKETAREVVTELVRSLQKKVQGKLIQAVKGSLHQATPNRRPRYREINWHKTIGKNLKHYQPQQKQIIPEQLVGYGRKRSALRDIILAVDQSGSMAGSLVYAAVFASVLASLPTLKSRLVLFSTAVVDMSDRLHDPVEILFGAQLGGGTNINRAIGYCQGIVERPEETILILITDLHEAGNQVELLQRVKQLRQSGVQMIVLLALNDKGIPAYNQYLAESLYQLGVISFACTPDRFPDLMAAALNREDLTRFQ